MLNSGRISVASLAASVWLGSFPVALASEPASTKEAFDRQVKPILSKFCFGCHAGGASEGSMSFDELGSLNDEEARGKWHRVLKMLRADLMPPLEEPHPGNAQIAAIENWIITGALGLDPSNPDPGKVTVRRLNRAEYRNTLRDLLGVDYDTSTNFPADNTGEGFDNIADVLSISPLLLEKYIDAAREVVSSTVPTASGVVRELRLDRSVFRKDPSNEAPSDDSNSDERQSEGSDNESLEFSYYVPATSRASLRIQHPGDYKLGLNLVALERYVDNVFDLNKCELTFSLDKEELLKREFVRQGGKRYSFTFDRNLSKGLHKLVISVKPLTEVDQVRRLRLLATSVTLSGPRDAAYYVKPENYDRFFPNEVPQRAEQRREYAKELLAPFATKAFRRPVDDLTVERLADLAETVYSQDNASFESGVAKAMTAVLASPRFLFREEKIQSSDASPYPLVDEYSLASRLSYFLWSSMPDEELLRLAGNGALRKNLDSQIARMLKDPRSQGFIENFAGQWLRARSIETVPISARSVLRREAPLDPSAQARRQRFFELLRKGDGRSEKEEEEFQLARRALRERFRRRPRVELTGEIRRAMRRETEMLFAHVVRGDRSVLEILDSDYTFLNEPLARHYQIDGVEGDEMRLVKLPAESVRGGVLTQGTFLAVTSNPDRTSPVKRGLFILENLLGTPTPAPPPNVPALEDAADESDGQKLSLRETLALHRQDPVCSSCHNRMDPLGLALEHFNALGRFRDQELGQRIDAQGVLITGEAFLSVEDLKRILVTTRKVDFYRCLVEKMMTYALGRAVEYTDVSTVDKIVNELIANDGRASVLLNGIIYSAAFQRTRRPPDAATGD